MSSVVIRYTSMQKLPSFRSIVYLLVDLILNFTKTCKLYAFLPNTPYTNSTKKKEEICHYDSKSAFKIQFW